MLPVEKYVLVSNQYQRYRINSLVHFTPLCSVRCSHYIKKLAVYANTILLMQAHFVLSPRPCFTMFGLWYMTEQNPAGRMSKKELQQMKNCKEE